MKLNSLFLLDKIVVNEKVNFLKFANRYQLFDTQKNAVGFVQQKVSFVGKIARLLIAKAFLPFELEIFDANENFVAGIKKPFTFWLPKVEIYNKNRQAIGYFKSKFKLLGTKFEVYDNQNNLIGLIEGNWKGWNFKITDSTGQQIGEINKKWSGAMKEIFTTADNYVVRIEDRVEEDEDKVMILSVAIAMDMILKENNS